MCAVILPVTQQLCSQLSQSWHVQRNTTKRSYTKSRKSWNDRKELGLVPSAISCVHSCSTATHLPSLLSAYSYVPPLSFRMLQLHRAGEVMIMVKDKPLKQTWSECSNAIITILLDYLILLSFILFGLTLWTLFFVSQLVHAQPLLAGKPLLATVSADLTIQPVLFAVSSCTKNCDSKQQKTVFIFHWL